MLLSKLQLNSFRNYSFRNFDFNSDVIAIHGNNGAGKTNILEAITLLSKGSGMRSADFEDIIYNNSSSGSFTIYSELQNHPQISKIGTSYSKAEGKRIIQIDGKTNNKIYPAIIWLNPQMDNLFLGSKQIRRKFLDKIVFDIDPLHLTRINSYDKSLRERINLLQKFGSNQEKWLDIIECKIAELGSAIAIARNDVIDYLNRAISQSSSNFIRTKIHIIGELEQMALSHKALEVEEEFVRKLKENRELDARSNRTNFGIHRSDFTAIMLDKNIEAKFCSTGEQKSILINITFARTKIFSLLNLVMPILLLDEITSHLDDNNRIKLFEEISKLNSQAFLTGISQEIFGNLERLCSKKVQFLEIK